MRVNSVRNNNINFGSCLDPLLGTPRPTRAERFEFIEKFFARADGNAALANIYNDGPLTNEAVIERMSHRTWYTGSMLRRELLANMFNMPHAKLQELEAVQARRHEQIISVLAEYAEKLQPVKKSLLQKIVGLFR